MLSCSSHVVRCLQRRLAPRLEAEARRETFDIKVYGQRVLDEIFFATPPPTARAHALTRARTRCARPIGLLWQANEGVLSGAAVPFAAVTASKDTVDVARLFLATLQVIHTHWIGALCVGLHTGVHLHGACGYCITFMCLACKQWRRDDRHDQRRPGPATWICSGPE